MVTPLRGIGGGWERLGGGRHKPKQGGTNGEPDTVGRINAVSLLGIHSFEFLSFHKHLVAFLQGGWLPVASLQVSKEGPLCNFYSFRERKTQVLQFTATPQHCQPLLGAGFGSGHAFNSKGVKYYLQSI